MKSRIEKIENVSKRHTGDPGDILRILLPDWLDAWRSGDLDRASRIRKQAEPHLQNLPDPADPRFLVMMKNCYINWNAFVCWSDREQIVLAIKQASAAMQAGDLDRAAQLAMAVDTMFKKRRLSGMPFNNPYDRPDVKWMEAFQIVD